MLQRLTEDFKRIFGKENNIRYFFAPGRINLIGEHIDYNGGYVLPATISLGTYAAVRKRKDNKIQFYSNNMIDSGIVTCNINDLAYVKEDGWTNFPKGMMYYLQKENFIFESGFDILYEGNIPNAAGLSSSASLEMVTGVMLNELYQLNIGMKHLVQVSQKVENEYIGVNSGIMDQFAIGFGQKDKAILLDCESLEYEYAPLHLQDSIIMIIHTNKSRSLAESKYNERRAQCEMALKDLQEIIDVDSLCQLTPNKFEEIKQYINIDVNRIRAEHVVYEHDRTKKAFQYLKKGDLHTFGKLMNESHHSLKELYEVTGIELDTIVTESQKQKGVLGARMTGAGFGGCAIAIVEKEFSETFKEEVNKVYRSKIGYNATFYEATIGYGARELREELGCMY